MSKAEATREHSNDCKSAPMEVEAKVQATDEQAQVNWSSMSQEAFLALFTTPKTAGLIKALEHARVRLTTLPGVIDVSALFGHMYIAIKDFKYKSQVEDMLCQEKLWDGPHTISTPYEAIPAAASA